MAAAIYIIYIYIEERKIFLKKSEVYFTNMRTTMELNLLQKLEKLLLKAGIKKIDFDRQFVAIKIHFGEPGGIAYLRPNYSKVVADMVKGFGGKPFLTDCNTLYVGRRKDALEHMEAAYENGYNPFCTGCHVIIADGLKGLDEVYVPVAGGEYVKEAKIGRAIMDADIIISMTHFKGHEQTGFGGVLKNLGMGSGSRSGKMEMHNSGQPEVDRGACVGCRRCTTVCAHGAIAVTGGKASIDTDKCLGCGRCIAVCPHDAISPLWDESEELVARKIAEYTKAVVDGRPNFHISFVVDVSPFCDCHCDNDLPIVPNLGIFASFDPVALDQACADAVMKAPVTGGSYLEDCIKEHGEGKDYFHTMHPTTRWESMLDQGEKLGIGTRRYNLIEV